MNSKLDAMQIAVSDTLELMGRLAEFHETPGDVVTWLQSPHPQLEHKTPENLIANGRAYDVHRIIERLEGTHTGTGPDNMTQPENRPLDQWTETDHVIFALAGLIRHASQAQAALLHDNTGRGQGCLKGYPQQLADELDVWVGRIRAQTGEDGMTGGKCRGRRISWRDLPAGNEEPRSEVDR